MSLIDVEISDSEGVRIPLRAYRGKPSLMLIEGTSAVSQNGDLKNRLRDEARARPDIGQKLNLIAIADMGGISRSGIAGMAALEIVKTAQKKEPAIKILIDWDGQVNAAFGTSPKNSNIIVLDKDLKPVFGSQGRMSREQIDALVLRIEKML